MRVRGIGLLGAAVIIIVLRRLGVRAFKNAPFPPLRWAEAEAKSTPQLGERHEVSTAAIAGSVLGGAPNNPSSVAAGHIRTNDTLTKLELRELSGAMGEFELKEALLALSGSQSPPARMQWSRLLTVILVGLALIAGSLVLVTGLDSADVGLSDFMGAVFALLLFAQSLLFWYIRGAPRTARLVTMGLSVSAYLIVGVLLYNQSDSLDSESKLGVHIAIEVLLVSALLPLLLEALSRLAPSEAGPRRGFSALVIVACTAFIVLSHSFWLRAIVMLF